MIAAKNIRTVPLRFAAGKISLPQGSIAEIRLRTGRSACAVMTAGRLGKIVGVSESTVVRFAAELGYDGYPSMRKALQEMIRNRLTSVQRIEVAKSMIDDNDIVRSIIGSDIQNLQATLEILEQDSYKKYVDSIIEAKIKYIVGMST